MKVSSAQQKPPKVDLNHHLHIQISGSAKKLLKMEAAKMDGTISDVIEWLAKTHLKDNYATR
jgi:hypothetical protein